MKTQHHTTSVPHGQGEHERGSPYSTEFIGLVLLALPLYAAFSVIENASWVRGLPPLIIPIVLALGLGHYLARRRHRRWIGYLVVIAAGVALTLALGLTRLPGGAQTNLGLFILAAVWFTTHLTLWIAHRGTTPIFMLLPGLLVLFISLSFLDSRYFLHLPLFLIASAPAAAHFHLRKWTKQRQKLLQLAPIAAGLVLMGGAVAFSWPTPTPGSPVRPEAAANTLEEPILRLWETTANFFENIPNRKGWPQFNLHPTLAFTGIVEQTEDVIMRVSATEPRKWRLRVYETYTPEGWTRVPEAPRTGTHTATSVFQPTTLAQREDELIQVRLFSTNTHVATAGIPLGSSVSGLLETSPQPIFNLEVNSPQTAYLPPDISNLRNSLAERQSTDVNVAELEAQLGVLGLTLSTPLPDESQPLESPLTVQRLPQETRPSTALLFVRRQTPPRSYTTLGSVSTATRLHLREAGKPTGTSAVQAQNYPSWITDRYLQLPPDFSQPVKDLAQDLAQGHDNTYDIAMSIQDYLHTLPYSTEIVPPPVGVDGVEWFITTQRVGFCNYFASAMITMLRSLDIPARMVVGFAPGEWDNQRDAWIVRAKHYHAWPEVYFPNYGWVEFEPTPSGVQPSLENLGFRTASPNAGNASFLDECFSGEFECDDGLAPDAGLDDLLLDDLDFGSGPFAAPVGGGGPPAFLIWLGTAIGIAAVGILGANLYLRYVTARIGPPAMVYSSMSLLARLGGVPRNAYDTPSEYGSRLAHRLPDHTPFIDNVIRSYQTSRYSRDKTPGDSQVQELRQSWKALRLPLLKLVLQRINPRRLFGTS